MASSFLFAAVGRPTILAGLVVLLALVTAVALQLLARPAGRRRVPAAEPWNEVRAAAAVAQASADEGRGGAALCAAACSVSGADGAHLWRLDEDGDLVAGETCGEAPRELRLRLPDEIRVELSEERADVARLAAAVRAQVVAATGALRAEVEPLTVNGRVVGCMTVTWTRYAPAPTASAHSLLALLAAHAAMLSERSELNRFARTDSLTGLPNRRAFDDELRREMNRAPRLGAPLAVALLDLDGFKALNDAAGHQAGDTALQVTTAAWAAQLREMDVLARLGGDEFALLLPSCAIVEGLEVVERVRLATPAGLSCSVGLTTWVPGEPAEALLGRADMALYGSKRGGRDRSTALDGSADPDTVAAVERPPVLS